MATFDYVVADNGAPPHVLVYHGDESVPVAVFYITESLPLAKAEYLGDMLATLLNTWPTDEDLERQFLYTRSGDERLRG